MAWGLQPHPAPPRRPPGSLRRKRFRRFRCLGVECWGIAACLVSASGTANTCVITCAVEQREHGDGQANALPPLLWRHVALLVGTGTAAAAAPWLPVDWARSRLLAARAGRVARGCV